MDRLEDDERPLSPEETLRLIEGQQARTSMRLGGDPLMIYTSWGVAWLAGFGALFVHYAYGSLTQNMALAVLFPLMILAMAISSFAQRKGAAGQVRGEASVRGTMYGFAWAFGFACMGALGTRLSPLLPPDESGLLWGVMSMTIVAVLYMAGGAIWRKPTMFFLGAGVAVLNVIGAVGGPGLHALLMSVGAGGGFVAVGVVQWWRQRDMP
jgi:hypothetical protein